MKYRLDELTAREREEFEQEKELATLQAEYQLKYKAIDFELKKLEARWTSWLRLPALIILLPVKFIMAFAIPISVITKKDLPEAYWQFMKG